MDKFKKPVNLGRILENSIDDFFLEKLSKMDSQLIWADKHYLTNAFWSILRQNIYSQCSEFLKKEIKEDKNVV